MLSYTSAVKIALDASPLTVSTGGIARYTAELACALAREFRENTYWLVADHAFPMPGCGSAGSETPVPANLHAGEPARGLVAKRWWSIGLSRELTRIGADLFHGTDFSVPYLPLRPSVMTIHDLSPWIQRDWQPDAARIRRRTAALLRARVPTMIATPSEAIRNAVIDRFQWPADRIAVTPLAGSEHFRPIACDQRTRPYFAFVGTLEPRKNIARLIEAWREVRKTDDIDLFIAGRRRHEFPPVAEEPGLHLAGAIPDADLPALYSGALAVVYPSLYEGFGLPVLEAMQCGALVVTSRDPALAEVAGDAALRVDDSDLAGTLAAIAAHPEAFREMRERAPARAAQFSWSRTAKMTQEVYAEAIRIFQR